MPGARYDVEGAGCEAVTADAEGRAYFHVDIDGRVEVTFAPSG